ncbi:MAG: hypothetical protein ABR898_06175 [Terracidiphilus sp.]|jgi:hypothetical protein
MSTGKGELGFMFATPYKQKREKAKCTPIRGVSGVGVPRFYALIAIPSTAP